MATALYIDTSAALRPVLESGTSPELESSLRTASLLITSPLAHVEAARTLLRLHRLSQTSEAVLADAQRHLDRLWARCQLWELSPEVCELACRVAPVHPVRALDALHLATYVLARRRIEGLELVTADERLRTAAMQI